MISTLLWQFDWACRYLFRSRLEFETTVRDFNSKTTSATRDEGFLDIHLNATTRWEYFPEPVRTYTLGGYQVLKKWLSYRESALLGRPLTIDVSTLGEILRVQLPGEFDARIDELNRP